MIQFNTQALNTKLTNLFYRDGKENSSIRSKSDDFSSDQKSPVKPSDSGLSNPRFIPSIFDDNKTTTQSKIAKFRTKQQKKRGESPEASELDTNTMKLNKIITKSSCLRGKEAISPQN